MTYEYLQHQWQGNKNMIQAQLRTLLQEIHM